MRSTTSSKSRRVACFLCAGVSAGLIFNSTLSFAQDEASNETEELVLEEVTVTGTRIKRKDFISASPLVTLDREAFEFSGQPTIEEYLNQMPQVQPDFGRTSNNPGDGTARVNLRGMGAGRTLVLLNGRRMAPSGVGSAVDINNLPRALMERVEIITGGASTVYGSDAVAGVVNFLTRQDFDGFSLDASYSVTAEGDATIYDANIAYGHNLASGRGNVTLYAGYYERKPVYASDRELTSVAYLDNWETGELDEGGSSVIPAGRVAFPQVDLGGGPVSLSWNPDGTPSAFEWPDDLYNFAPVNYLQTPLTRFSVGLMSTIDVSENFEAYFEATFTRNEARQNLAPAPVFLYSVVNIDNPVLTPETRQVFEEQMVPEGPGLVGMYLFRRMQEMGPRIFDHSRDYVRVVAGTRGKFGNGWDLDAWITNTDASETAGFLNYFSESRFAQGLLVDPVSGQCFDPTGGCVPLDVFGEDRLSDEGADFIRIPPILDHTERTQTLASVVVTGSPFDIWSGPLDVAFGAEWRRDKGTYEYQDGDTPQEGSLIGVDGTESVFELYTEALVPIMDDASSQTLNLELGVRWSDYKHAGPVWTWKAGLEWTPLEFLRFRAMYQHAVRAPNLEEMFTARTTYIWAWADGDDPCSASLDPVGSGNAEKCIATGMPPEQIGIFEALEGYPVTTILGGNPDLEPESSDTFTIGGVFSPISVPGLVIAVDYYDLEITDTIGDISAMGICFDPLNTKGVFCDHIRRDETLNIAELNEPTSNRGLQGTTGIDTQVQYIADLPSSMSLFDDYARFIISTTWTHLLSNEYQENIVTEVYDCAGYFGQPCVQDLLGAAVPVNRVTSNFTYSSHPLDINLTWRWIEGTRNAAPFWSADWGYPDPNLAVPFVSSRNYFDLGFAYSFNDAWIVRAGINNLIDEQPPLMADTVWSNNTDTGLYDIFGRTFYISVSVEL